MPVEECPFKVGDRVLDTKYNKLFVFTAVQAKTPALYCNSPYGFERFVDADSCANPNDVQPLKADITPRVVKEKVKNEAIPTPAENEQKLLPQVAASIASNVPVVPEDEDDEEDAEDELENEIAEEEAEESDDNKITKKDRKEK